MVVRIHPGKPMRFDDFRTALRRLRPWMDSSFRPAAIDATELPSSAAPCWALHNLTNPPPSAERLRDPRGSNMNSCVRNTSHIGLPLQP
jgi:hypothetical protein